MRRKSGVPIAASGVLALLLAAAAVTPATAQNETAFVPFSVDAYRMVNSIDFSPDGQRMFFALLYHDFLAYRGVDTTGAPEVALFSSDRTQDGWSEPELLPFSGVFHDYEPSLGADGSLMVFNSHRPYPDGRTPDTNDLWMVERSGEGWTPPTRIGEIATFEREESYGTLAADRTLVFVKGRLGPGEASSYDLYESRFRDGAFTDPQRHAVSTDEWGEGDPWVAPDQSYLIFTRWNESGDWAETVDLYISFNDGDGWSEPEPLDELNTDGADFAPAVSPEGDWLYYRASGRFRRVPLEPVLAAHR